MRLLVRWIARSVAAAIVLPMVLCELLLRKAFARDVMFTTFAQLLSLLPGTSGSFLRNAYYHFMLESCPLGCAFSFGMVFTHSKVKVGRCVYVGSFSMVGLAEIGDYTMLADHVHVLSGARQHGTEMCDIPYQQQPQIFRMIKIGKNAWIGTNSVIMDEVGDDCVIGAASVVTKPIPAGSVAVGNPARVIRSQRADPSAAAALSAIEKRVAG